MRLSSAAPTIVAHSLPCGRAILVRRGVTRIGLQQLTIVGDGGGELPAVHINVATPEERHGRIGVQFECALKFRQCFGIAMLLFQTSAHLSVRHDQGRLQANGIGKVAHGRVVLLEMLEDEAATVARLRRVGFKRHRIAEGMKSVHIIPSLDLLFATL